MSLPGIPTQLTFLLVHESAHAILGAHFFGPRSVKSVRYGAFLSSKGQPCVGMVTFTMSTPLMHRRDAWGAAIVHIGGWEAEKMLGGVSKFSSASDFDAAADACEGIALRTGKAVDFKALYHATRGWLIKYWARIESLADALVRSDDAELRGPALQRLLTINNDISADPWA
jgi:hypothetical protein